MSTLVLRFAAPLQSWGIVHRYPWRGTSREPTKSAVVGMLAAALGRSRSQPIDDLTDIEFGVRIDQPGKLIRDYQTAKTVDGKIAFISYRDYLSDAVFVVGIQDDNEKLLEYEQALRNPYYPLFLGRRSCPPTEPFLLGIRVGVNLIQALKDEPWQASEFHRKQLQHSEQTSLEIVVDTSYGTKDSYTQRDSPLSFDQTYRRYASRSVIKHLTVVVVELTEDTIELAKDNAEEITETTLLYATDHDAIIELGG